MARIVVVEDDARQAALVRAYLERDGHAVYVAPDGRAGLDAIRRVRPDLVVLDLMLPKVDGLDVCRALRAESAVPIVMVTARSTEEDALLGFDLGADDYVTKPYSMRQLVARIRAVLRRSGAERSIAGAIVIDGLRLDSERCEVSIDGRDVELTARELALLETLASRPGRVWSRRELLEEIAGFDHYAMERTIDMHVANLRRKLEVDPTVPRYLLTVKGRGYKLADGRPDA